MLPSREFFPDANEPSDASVRTLVERVCGYMQVSPELIDLQFYSEARRPRLVNDRGDAIGGTAGTYHEGDDRFVIRIERQQFDHPMTLVGTVAHELAHVRLLGESRIPRDVFDNELLTDLTVVYHGMGIFLANVPRHWDGDSKTWPGTEQPRSEYMTASMFGYALARRCWLREEPKPKWARHLRPAARAEFKAALRFLISTEATQS